MNSEKRLFEHGVALGAIIAFFSIMVTWAAFTLGEVSALEEHIKFLNAAKMQDCAEALKR